jgi:hypothetical protein
MPVMTAIRILAALTVTAVLVAVPSIGHRVAVAGTSCDGEFRWAIKTLSDANNGDVVFHARRTRVQHLRSLSPPATLANDTPRISPVEDRTYSTRARVLKARIEDDSDVILVIAAPRQLDKTMVVEFPYSRCVDSAFKRDQIAAARQAVLDKCGPLTSRFKALRGAMHIRGVGFWNRRPGEPGDGPNALQLFPALHIRGTCSQV